MCFFPSCVFKWCNTTQSTHILLSAIAKSHAGTSSSCRRKKKRKFYTRKHTLFCYLVGWLVVRTEKNTFSYIERQLLLWRQSVSAHWKWRVCVVLQQLNRSGKNIRNCYELIIESVFLSRKLNGKNAFHMIPIITNKNQIQSDWIVVYANWFVTDINKHEEAEREIESEMCLVKEKIACSICVKCYF